MCQRNDTLYQRPQNDVWICHSVTFITRRNTTQKQQTKNKQTILNPLCPRQPITTHSILASQLVQMGTGFLQDLQPHFCQCALGGYFRQCPLLKVWRVWEMLWIFKVARWAHNRCTKINKSPTVSHGTGASSSEIWTANMAQLPTLGTLANSWSFNLEIWPSQLPCRHPNKTRHSDEDISYFFLLGGGGGGGGGFFF